MSARQLLQLEHGYLMALSVVDYYRLQLPEDKRESLKVDAYQFAAVSGLDWSELEELEQHLKWRGISG